MLKAKLIERSIPKLNPIVIVNSFQAIGMLIVTSKPSFKSAQTLHPCFPGRKTQE
jgi:hypothetical protein